MSADEPPHRLGPGERPARLGPQGGLYAGGDALAVDRNTVAVEYHQFDRLDHSVRSGGSLVSCNWNWYQFLKQRQKCTAATREAAS
ncbi:hypothetical protein [Streptomyces sp. SCSIO 30461]|uniref:hypothetical protein n=1 Tax=Streptomyces sp. SCSIO 30461 TaxID=3118085 RepID=UPI00387E6AB4